MGTSYLELCPASTTTLLLCFIKLRYKLRHIYRLGYGVLVQFLVLRLSLVSLVFYTRRQLGFDSPLSRYMVILVL